MVIKFKKLFESIIIDGNGCWVRTINITGYGYTVFRVNNKRLFTHRFMFEYYNGYIDPDLHIDHLCRNRKCCNPIHLELVTMRENLNRGSHFKRDKTSCPQGHEYTKENTYYYPKYRRCKICLRKQVKEYKLRKHDC